MNPFGRGPTRSSEPPSTGMVIFGATGDLTHRKLIPALYDLYQDQHLPPKFFVVGASRSKLSDQEYRDSLTAGVKKFARTPYNETRWLEFAQKIYFQPTNGTDLADFHALRERLAALEGKLGENVNYLYYFAVSPEFFATISGNLKASGLIESPEAGLRRTVAVVEKPFGNDTESAKKLNAMMQESFDESQIYRIDHYLGKETVQNILVLRFINGIFEPLWNRKYIDQIQISVCEEIGVGNRAPYFEQTGITRDIVQNHVLQVLALLCSEPPISLRDADSIRNEKVKVLRSMRRYTAEEAAENTVRAQYLAGHINGQEVAGYLNEKGVDPNSQTETFVAMKLAIDNWRWDGVPIYVRAGKRLPKRITEIAVYFKEAPRSFLSSLNLTEQLDNVLTIQVQPYESISLRVAAKTPGPHLTVRPVEMNFAYDESFGVSSPAAYERLILDAMKGDSTLFTRADEIVEAWDLLEPIFAAWSAQDSGCAMETHESGSWGPKKAGALLAKSGHRWRRL